MLIPTFNFFPEVYNHISKVIESCRVHLFDIITQYRAVFPDDDMISSASNSIGSSVDVVLFYGWVNEKVRCCFVLIWTPNNPYPYC